MAKRKLNKEELLLATESLLLEKGYAAFNFTTLASRLNVGRSTLYEYYQSKEELITIYMEEIMTKVINDCESLREVDNSLEKIKELIKVFMKYNQIHQLVQIIPLLNKAGLNQDHYRLMGLVTELIEGAKKDNYLNQELPSPVIAGILFNSINIPNMLRIEHQTWGEMIFNSIYYGIKS